MVLLVFVSREISLKKTLNFHNTFVYEHQDPKEYLPFLNELRAMDANYQRFTIDKHLRRYSSALVHISRCPEEERFTECVKLVTEHKLYSVALDLFDRGSERYKVIRLKGY